MRRSVRPKSHICLVPLLGAEISGERAVCARGKPKGEPVIPQFRSDLSLVLRDGQTVESTFATDPLKVFKVEVSLNLLK